MTPDDAKPDGCQECVMGAPFYVPCNRPATRLIAWPRRGEGPYRMCDRCAGHNTKNRGATDVGSYVPVAEMEIPQ